MRGEQSPQKKFQMITAAKEARRWKNVGRVDECRKGSWNIALTKRGTDKFALTTRRRRRKNVDLHDAAAKQSGGRSGRR